MQESFEGNLWVASQVIPQLNMIQVIRSWAAMNVSVDGAPILGESKEVPGFYNLVSVNGVTLGPLLGELTAEVVCTQKKVLTVKPALYHFEMTSSISQCVDEALSYSETSNLRKH